MYHHKSTIHKRLFCILLHTGISVRQTQAKLSFDGIKFKKPSLAQRLEKPICSQQEAKVIRSRWIAKYPWNAIFSIHQHFSRILMKKQILQHHIGFCHVLVLWSLVTVVSHYNMDAFHMEPNWKMNFMTKLKMFHFKMGIVTNLGDKQMMKASIIIVRRSAYQISINGSLNFSLI